MGFTVPAVRLQAKRTAAALREKNKASSSVEVFKLAWTCDLYLLSSESCRLHHLERTQGTAQERVKTAHGHLRAALKGSPYEIQLGSFV